MAGPWAGRGFTLVELITVMILLGILAVVALPNLNQAQGFGAASFNDRVAAALRFAQKSAVAHRRTVCATVAPGSLTLTIDGSFGVGTCAVALAGPDGANPAASAPANVTLTAVPAGPLYFQPSGAVTSNAAGTTIANFTLTVTGQTAITVTGATGYVN
ncbi:MAG TPA: GspH/FimT family pseudopilin [Rhodocyclaceae bacterium]|nr:GspH/FimT family pseudopilin [Rhodocyclaceae bacterium]